MKMQEKGSTVYSPYPTKLERQAILQMSLQRLHILLSCFKDPERWSDLGLELSTSRYESYWTVLFFAEILVHKSRHTQGD